MKYITQEWDRQYDGILFFIQRLEEMLFHYSDDIVKAPVHNTATLIEEYCIAEKDKAIKSFYLNSIACELAESLKNDNIVKEKLGADHVKGIIDLINIKQSETVHYLKGIVSTQAYYSWCKEYLLKHILVASHKREIDDSLRSWISSLSWKGYALEYIYRKLHSIYEVSVDDPKRSIQDFINSFDFEPHDFRVYFLFQSNSISYKKLLEDRLHICFEDDGNFYKLRKPKNKSYIGYLEEKGIDPYNAKMVALSRVDIFLSFYRVISNRKKPLLGKTSLTIDKATKAEMYISVEAKGYRAIEIDPKHDIGTTIDYLILRCQTKSRRTIQHLKRMMNLHNMALAQIDLYDGFVNLWSVLEVVSQESSVESKIESVIDSCLPILQNDFIVKLFESIDNDLISALSKEDYDNLLNEISLDSKILHKIMCFVLLDEYESLRERYFEKLKNYPNIRDKIYRIYLLKDSKKELFHLSDSYAKRVRWHLYRLYRARNGIVHAGEKVRNIQVLGEHLHIYCDGVLLEILHKFAYKDSLKTINDVLVDTRLLVNAKKSFFSLDGVVTEADIKCYTLNYFDEFRDL